MPVDAGFEQYIRAFLLGISLGNLMYYGLLSTVLWLLFSVVYRKKLRHRKISPRDPAPGQIRREVWQSLRSIAIWGAINVGVIYATSRGWTRFYRSIDEYGWGWFALSFVLMIVAHDAYFYWTHRLMHHPKLYRLVHRDHHLSTSPTVWGSYAFGPLEAIVQAGICPLVVLTMPVHPAAYAAFMVSQIGFTVVGHCGHEVFPRWFVMAPIPLLFNTVTQHTLHHEKFKACFGLYFNTWDRIMGTNDPDYKRRFKLATTPPAEQIQPPASPHFEQPEVVASPAPLCKAG